MAADANDANLPRRARLLIAEDNALVRGGLQVMLAGEADLEVVGEAENGRRALELCRELEPGFVSTVFEWAEGKALDDVLDASGMPAGDFVRNCKQLLDLLRQILEAADPEAGSIARAAHDAINRSVVSYTGV